MSCSSPKSGFGRSVVLLTYAVTMAWIITLLESGSLYSHPPVSEGMPSER